MLIRNVGLLLFSSASVPFILEFSSSNNVVNMLIVHFLELSLKFREVKGATFEVTYEFSTPFEF